MHNLVISINIWDQYIELKKNRKEALILDFLPLVSVNNLSGSTSFLRHCGGLRSYLKLRKFGLS